MFNLTPSSSSVTVSPLTELSAVNGMLSASGHTPLNSLEDARNADSFQARRALADASREVQLEGWYFNTSRDVTLTPDLQGRIKLPHNVIRLDIAPNSRDYGQYDVVQHGSEAYDLKNRTYIFSSPIVVTLVLFFPFELLPDAARAYIAARATRRFRHDVTGGDDSPTLRESEARARATLMREHNTQSDRGFLSWRKDTYLGHSSVGRVLSGRRRL